MMRFLGVFAHAIPPGTGAGFKNCAAVRFPLEMQQSILFNGVGPARPEHLVLAVPFHEIAFSPVSKVQPERKQAAR
ncbi:hypothetical protein BMJ35_26175 [Sinorhizobium medicae]|nr:hypothetical protein BMJ35_26175 [Sinorhizobium medicae]PLU24757.1 hypothetical protein BMJ31_11530 [Sinorhizobium medicae]PLU70258.1 hypothetical protein BMJ21_13720 [Sinorhizobium medicae]